MAKGILQGGDSVNAQNYWKQYILLPKKIVFNTDMILIYVRYADDFLVGVSGTRAQADLVKERLTIFLRSVLKLTLREEKTKITIGVKGVVFLGFKVYTSTRRVVEDRNGLLMPLEQRTRIFIHTASILEGMLNDGLVKKSSNGKSVVACR